MLQVMPKTSTQSVVRRASRNVTRTREWYHFPACPSRDPPTPLSLPESTKNWRSSSLSATAGKLMADDAMLIR